MSVTGFLIRLSWQFVRGLRIVQYQLPMQIAMLHRSDYHLYPGPSFLFLLARFYI